MATASLSQVILFAPPCISRIIFGILGIRRASVCVRGKGMEHLSGLILGCVGRGLLRDGSSNDVNTSGMTWPVRHIQGLGPRWPCLFPFHTDARRIPRIPKMIARRPPRNEEITASLVLGVILFVPPCGLLAIIFGILGIRRASVCGKGKGMAISGLILGCVGLCIMPLVLTSLLLPSLNSPRPTANRIKSASNLRLIGQACIMYSNENAGKLPPDWGDSADERRPDHSRLHLFRFRHGSPIQSSCKTRGGGMGQRELRLRLSGAAGNDSNAIPATTVIAYEKTWHLSRCRSQCAIQ